MHIRRLIMQIVAYALYAMVAFVVFLYLTFPYDLLQQRLIEWGSQEGVQLTMARLHPAFPPGIRAQGVRLVLEQFSPHEAIVQLETLHVQPEWSALLARKVQAHFEAGLYSGRLEGDVSYVRVEGTPLWDVKMRFVDLEMAQHALMRQGDAAFLRGRLGGDATVALDSDGRMQDGIFNLRLQPMVLSGIPGWALQLQREVVCDTVQGELKATSRQGGNMSLICQGKDLTVEARGTMGWKEPLMDSQLNVRWQVRSDEAYKQEMELLAALVRKRLDRRGELSFRLQGPLRQLRLGA